jgi:hypothetical protein
MNVILRPDVFQRLHVTVLNNSHLIVDGSLKKLAGVGSVKVTDVPPASCRRRLLPRGTISIESPRVCGGKPTAT